MKYIITFISILIFFFSSCKCREHSVKQNENNVSVTQPAGSTSGKVSHMYRETGCNTVIIVTRPEDTLTLIPAEALPEIFDKDGLEIQFNYRLLRIRNPEGCSVGLPAEITDISGK